MDNPELKNLYKVTMLTFSMQGFPFQVNAVPEITEASEAVWNHWQTTIEESRKRGSTRLDRRGYNAGHCMCAAYLFQPCLIKLKRQARIKGKNIRSSAII